jgi:phosphoserine aminotransferase
MKPAAKPQNPNFSSGPCSKRPNYDLASLSQATLGRSHRSSIGKAALAEAIDMSKDILGLPEGYRLGIVAGSDTGAFEMAMWSLLGPKAVEIFAWESFGSGWVTDVVKQLKLEQVEVHTADYGQLPDLSIADPSKDIVFTLNGTTSGVKVANLDWISDTREGLTLCDATSGVFAMDVDWSKIDVCTYSWQKVLGGEGAHGVLILSPRAVERLESYVPTWPLPKIFRLTKAGKLIEGIFKGATINTPSMLCVEDYLDALRWVNSVGGLQGAISRSRANLAALENFVDQRDWISFLAADESIRSNTSVCLSLKLEDDQVKQLVKLLDAEGVAYDIGAYRDAPAGLRIWCGATIETTDIEAMLPWLDWAFAEVGG